MNSHFFHLIAVFFICLWSLTSGGSLSVAPKSELRTCLLSFEVEDSSLIEYSVGGEKYEKANYQWNILLPHKTPVGYLMVKGPSDVQAAVRCAKANNIRLVAKGGGHSYEEYSFGDNNTLIVDLQLLTELKVAEDRMSFTIGAGALLGHVAYPLLEYHGLVTPHGTCPTVGIVGLALGGGYGYLSRLFGLTTDNVIAIEMVDSFGRVLNVNKQNDPDLLWAMRGAGQGSFGIVTKLTMRAYEQPEVMISATKIYTLDRFPEVFVLWQQAVSEINALKDVNTKLTAKNGQLVVELFDIQLKRPVGNQYARILELLNRFPLTASTNETFLGESVYSDFLFRTSHPGDIGVTDPAELQNVTRHMFTQRNFRAKSYFAKNHIDSDGVVTIYSLLEETLRGINDIIIEMYAFGGAINDMSPVDDTAFNHRSDTFYLVQAFYNSDPTTSEPDKENSLDWLRRFYETTQRVVRHTQSYQNYPDGELDGHLEKYYGSNLNRLIQVKNSVDPLNIFRHPQSIPLSM